MAKRIVDEEMRFSVIINGDEAQKELFDLEKSTRDLTRTNKELRAERTRLKNQGKQETAEYKKLDAQIKENNATLKSNKSRMAELRSEIGIAGLSMRQLKQEASRLKLQLYNMVPGSAEYKRLTADLEAVDARIRELRLNAGRTRFSIGSLADGFNRYAAMAASFIATGTGMVLSLQKMIDYNGKLSDAQADVMKTTQMSKEEVDELTKSFGLLETRTKRINLLKIAEEGGRIGIAKDEIGDFVRIMDKAVVALSDSFPGGVEETASKLGKLKLLFKETKEQDVGTAYNAIGSAINDLGAEGVASEANIANFATRVGSLPDVLKPSIADALALGAAFEESGVEAEIASRAYGIILKQAAENTGEFARVMGKSRQEVEDLINADPVAFMLEFAASLNGLSATDTAETLGELGVNADGANKVIGALSNNTARFTELMNLSNRSMVEGNSLINEFNVKNNNLAATFEKIQKKMMGWFSSETISNSLNVIAQGFAKLIGAAKDLDEVWEDEINSTYESARANQEAARTGKILLEEYQELTKDGVEPTGKAKQRLEEITLLLRDSLGESVVAIDTETGALNLNTEAVRKQIMAKRIAADEEASTLASRLEGNKEAIKRQEQQLRAAEKEAEIRSRLISEEDQRYADQIARSQNPQAFETPESVKNFREAQQNLRNANEELTKLETQQMEILKRLSDLNYTEADLENIFNPSVSGQEAKEGEEKLIGGLLYRFSGGKWQLVSKKPTGPGSGGDAASRLRNEEAELRRIREENIRLEASLISDAFKRELATARANHEIKIAELKDQMATEAELKAMTPEQRRIAVEKNRELNRQIQFQEELHQLELGKILQEGLQNEFEEQRKQFEREKRQREIAHQKELLALGNDEQAKKVLQEKFNKEEAEREAKHLEDLIAQMKRIMGGESMSFNLEILTEEQKQQLLDFLDKANIKLGELLNKASGSDGSINSSRIDGNVDILGFTIDQWDETFKNLDTVEQKIEAAEMAAGAMMNAWGMYSNFVAQKQQVELQQFERAQDQKRQALDRQLDRGLINRRQYNQAVEAMERETRKKQAEMQYKQAKREKQMMIANIIMNTAAGVAKALAQGGFVLGVPWAAIVGALGAVQLGLAAATPLPSRGYQDGYYPVRREQDGKVFDVVYGGKPRSGLVDRPTHFIAGEQGKDFPEMIIDGSSWKKMDPGVKQSLQREVARVRGYASGYYKEDTAGKKVANSDIDPSEERMALMAVVGRATIVLEKLEQNGVIAKLVRDTETARQISEDIDDYKKLRNANRLG